MKGKDFLLFGAVSGALAVLIGAFGAHWLKSFMTPDELSNFKTASDYHFIHSIMLVFTGYYAHRKQKSRSLIIGGYAFLVGIILFCLSLYAYAILSDSWLAIITPFGGLCFVVGWMSIAIDAIIEKL